MSRIAVIDLGTNTFNLLIVDVNLNKTYTNIFQEKISVKLAESGINTKLAFAYLKEELKL